MKQKYELYLQDILTAIHKIKNYTKSLQFDDFRQNGMIIDAVTRNLEIIGEAVAQLPEEIKQKYANVPWDEIKRFRNVVVHKYWVVDVDILWDIIKNKLGFLQRQIRKIVRKEARTQS